MTIPIPWIIKMDDRLANGRGMTDCELVGITGGCGDDCPVFLAGKCESEDEILESLQDNDTLEEKYL